MKPELLHDARALCDSSITHTQFASRVFGIEESEVTKDQRDFIKKQRYIWLYSNQLISKFWSRPPTSNPDLWPQIRFLDDLNIEGTVTGRISSFEQHLWDVERQPRGNRPKPKTEVVCLEMDYAKIERRVIMSMVNDKSRYLSMPKQSYDTLRELAGSLSHMPEGYAEVGGRDYLDLVPAFRPQPFTGIRRVETDPGEYWRQAVVWSNPRRVNAIHFDVPEWKGTVLSEPPFVKRSLVNRLWLAFNCVRAAYETQ